MVLQECIMAYQSKLYAFKGINKNKQKRLYGKNTAHHYTQLRAD